MATLEQCRDAVQGLVDRLAEVDPELRAKYVVERTVSCVVRDLDVTFTARLTDEGITDMRTTEDGASAQVRLATSSDDLLALADGRLSIPAAWATGRLKVDASVLDLLKLRSLL